MIITDFKQLREVPAGEIVTLVMQFKVVKADEEDENPCRFCVFEGSICSTCCRQDRPDGESIKYVKI